MMVYVEWCDPGCKQVGLKSFVVSIDYRDYMGSSSKIWALRCLFLYLCSYNLVGSVTIYPKPSYKLLYAFMIGEIKCPINIPLPCAFHFISFPPLLMQHMHQPIINDMIHFLSSRDRIGSSILTSHALHRRLGSSTASHHSTCPSHLQPICRPNHVLIFSILITWLNVMSHVQWAPSSPHVLVFATSLSHFTSMAYVAHKYVHVD
jgi:hypothetical protein